MILNGEGMTLGRLSTYIAKQLLAGEKVHVVNAEKIVITGNPKDTVKKYFERRERGNPHHGPYFPSKPADIVRRSIRGMLPKARKGRQALRLLRVYEGSAPKELEKKEIKELKKREISSRFLTVKDLSKALK